MKSEELRIMVLKVKDLLDKYFDGKKDKGGHPYIWHLDSVALAVEKEKERSRYASWNINDEAHFVDYDRAIVVAYLHDILEDTDCTIDELRETGVDDTIIDVVVAITRRKDEDKYSDFIKRVKKNPIAKLVKIYDLENNMDIRRLSEFGDKEMKRLHKYWHSWKFLKDEITKEEYDKAFN